MALAEVQAREGIEPLGSDREFLIAAQRDAELDAAHRVHLGEEAARITQDEARLGGDTQRELDPATKLASAAGAAEQRVPAALEVDALVVASAAEDAAVLFQRH